MGHYPSLRSLWHSVRVLAFVFYPSLIHCPGTLPKATILMVGIIKKGHHQQPRVSKTGEVFGGEKNKTKNPKCTSKMIGIEFSNNSLCWDKNC